jgi:hypothetical protein
MKSFYNRSQLKKWLTENKGIVSKYFERVTIFTDDFEETDIHINATIIRNMIARGDIRYTHSDGDWTKYYKVSEPAQPISKLTETIVDDDLPF